MKCIRFYILVCCITLSGSLHAQSVDSLQRILNTTTDPVQRIPLLKQLADIYSDQRDTLAIQYFEELVELSQYTDDEVLKPYYYYRMGVCRFQHDDITRSTNLYFKGLEFTKESSPFDKIKAMLYNAIGWNFDLIGKYPMAVEYYSKAEFFSKSIDHPQLKALILNNKGVAYKNLEKYDSAFLCFQKSLSLNRKSDNPRQVRFNLNNIGIVLSELKRFKEAKSFLNEALTLNLEAQDTIEIINNLLNLSGLIVDDSEVPQAKSQLNKALALAVKGKFIEQQRRVYNALMNLAERGKNYEEAFQYQREFYKLTDSLYRRESTNQVLEIEAKYNGLIKDRDLQEAKKNVVEQRFYLTLIVGALLLTLIVIFFLWRLIRIKNANEMKLVELNHEIEAQAEELKQSNEEIIGINDNLEALVKNRTLIIENQNKRLLEFAFMNSHKIRGPLATLLGLLNLLYEDKAPGANKELINHLKTTAAKMDEIIHEVSRQLEKEEKH